MDKKKIKETVRKSYAKFAQEGCGCGCSNSRKDNQQFALSIGYSQEELRVIPQEANLALSCGNPIAIADIREGEVVLDLGSGAGFDCFIAAHKVGERGKVIGIDMTPEMVDKAKFNASAKEVENVVFILGEIENLPLEDNSIDVVISNCVINLSTDKQKVFQEIYRVLKPSGRIAISDIALIKALPRSLKEDAGAYVGCVAGAVLVEDYKKMVINAGFSGAEFTVKESTIAVDLSKESKTELINDFIVSLCVRGFK